MATETRLTRIESGLYQFGVYTLRGQMLRGDGRQGSRYNGWLVYRNGILEADALNFGTLDQAVQILGKRLAKAAL